MTPKQRRSSQSPNTTARELLLEATVDLIQTQGTSAATSRAITNSAQENLAAITYYFGSKDTLITEALLSIAQGLLEPVVAALTDEQADPGEKLTSVALLLYEIINNNEHLLSGYLHSLAAAANNDAVKDEIQRLHQTLTSILANELEKQQHNGGLPSWLKPEPMAKLLLAVANGIAITMAIDPANTDPTAIGSQLVHLVLAAQPNEDNR